MGLLLFAPIKFYFVLSLIFATPPSSFKILSWPSTLFLVTKKQSFFSRWDFQCYHCTLWILSAQQVIYYFWSYFLCFIKNVTDISEHVLLAMLITWVQKLQTCSLKYGQDLQHRITQGAHELNGNMDAERKSG